MREIDGGHYPVKMLEAAKKHGLSETQSGKLALHIERTLKEGLGDFAGRKRKLFSLVREAEDKLKDQAERNSKLKYDSHFEGLSKMQKLPDEALEEMFDAFDEVQSHGDYQKGRKQDLARRKRWQAEGFSPSGKPPSYRSDKRLY
jgi:hypothetical protein